MEAFLSQANEIVLPLRLGRLGKNFAFSEVVLLDPPPPLSMRLEELEVEVVGGELVDEVGILLELELLLLLLLFHEEDKEAPFSLNPTRLSISNCVLGQTLPFTGICLLSSIQFIHPQESNIKADHGTTLQYKG